MPTRNTVPPIPLPSADCRSILGRLRVGAFRTPFGFPAFKRLEISTQELEAELYDPGLR